MRYLLLIPLLILYTSAAAEEPKLYRWVDEKGKVHFSDKAPAKDAKTYKPKPILVIPAAPAGNFKADSKPASKEVKYKSMTITAPTHDQVFTPDKTASIAVGVSLQPALHGGLHHKIALYLDGELHTKSKQFTFNLQDLPRGTHTVHAAVLDKHDKAIISSESISFHVQKHHR